VDERIEFALHPILETGVISVARILKVPFSVEDAFQVVLHILRVPPVGVRDLIDGVRYVHEVQEVDSWGRALQNRRRGS
jgi:hypothetical protein